MLNKTNDCLRLQNRTRKKKQKKLNCISRYFALNCVLLLRCSTAFSAFSVPVPVPVSIPVFLFIVVVVNTIQPFFLFINDCFVFRLKFNFQNNVESKETLTRRLFLMSLCSHAHMEFIDIWFDFFSIFVFTSVSSLCYFSYFCIDLTIKPENEHYNYSGLIIPNKLCAHNACFIFILFYVVLWYFHKHIEVFVDGLFFPLKLSCIFFLMYFKSYVEYQVRNISETLIENIHTKTVILCIYSENI